MGTSLSGLLPQDTYQGLIKVGDNTAITSTLKTLSDGAGNNLPMQASSTGINFTGTTTGLTSGVSGAIQFSNGSAFASDAANFFWDDTNNRLGLGTATPTSLLNLSGSSEATPSGTTGGILNIIGSATNALVMGSLSTSPFGLYIQGGGSGLYPLLLNPNGSNVGIATTDPTAKLHIKGSGSTSATTSLLVQNSAGSSALTITDDRVATFGQTIIVGSGGAGTKTITSTGYYVAQRASMQNPADGVLLITNAAETSFDRLQLGGTTASFPSLKRASNNIEIKNADDTFGAGLSVGATLNASAILQADSTTKGFLPPRMTTTQKNAIASPATGLQVFDSTMNATCEYTGSAWRVVSAGSQALAAPTATTSVDLSAGNVVNLSLTSSTTLTLTGAAIGTYIMRIIQGGSGSYTITWPGNVIWSGGTTPTLTTTVGKSDIVTLIYDGTNYYGNYSLNY